MKNIFIEIGSVAVNTLPGNIPNPEALGHGIERALGRRIEAGRVSAGPRTPEDRVAEAVAEAIDRATGKR